LVLATGYEGTSEIQRLVIASEALGPSLVF
jgi:alkylation response protein AidB-like acyl-CoA dehydrogenase